MEDNGGDSGARNIQEIATESGDTGHLELGTEPQQVVRKEFGRAFCFLISCLGPNYCFNLSSIKGWVGHGVAGWLKTELNLNGYMN